MPENCVICLEELCSSSASIGTIVPCGHVVHRTCFRDFTIAHTNNITCSSNTRLPRCPICKQKSKKFIPLFLSFDQPPLCQTTTETATATATATENMQSLSLQNSSLRSKINQLTSLSKDQSDILLDLLPKVDLLEDELQATHVEKEQLNKQVHSLEAENVELITDWNEVEIKLEVLKNENCILKRQLKDSKQKIMSFTDKEVAAEQRFQKQKKKRKRVEMEKAETEQVLEIQRFEARKLKKEKHILEADLMDTMGELESLKKRVKKMKKRYIANGSLRSGKENRNARELKVHRGGILLKEKVKNRRISHHRVL